jgi:hypothetical protein
MSGKEFQAGEEVYVRARVRDKLEPIDSDGDLELETSVSGDCQKTWADPSTVISAADVEAALQAKATLDTLHSDIGDREVMAGRLAIEGLADLGVEHAMAAIYRPEPAKPEPNRLTVTFKNFVTEELEKAFGAGFSTLGDVVARALEKAASRVDELKAVE